MSQQETKKQRLERLKLEKRFPHLKGKVVRDQLKLRKRPKG